VWSGQSNLPWISTQAPWSDQRGGGGGLAPCSAGPVLAGGNAGGELTIILGPASPAWSWDRELVGYGLASLHCEGQGTEQLLWLQISLGLGAAVFFHIIILNT